MGWLGSSPWAACTALRRPHDDEAARWARPEGRRQERRSRDLRPGDEYLDAADAALPGPRAYHQATLLTCTGPCSYNGKVLITGGDDGTVGNTAGTTFATTFIFDPATNTLSAGPDMSTARDSHSATALAAGRVLIAGGEQMSAPSTYVALNSAEIFDPTLSASGCAPSTLGCMVAAASMTDARFSDGAVRLGNGKVLVAGGSNDYDCPARRVARERRDLRPEQ
jgi:hypothetical protein